jgi:hypothetical protein
MYFLRGSVRGELRFEGGDEFRGLIVEDELMLDDIDVILLLLGHLLGLVLPTTHPWHSWHPHHHWIPHRHHLSVHPLLLDWLYTP